jgi:spermidine/putrescine transport system permease protein
MLLPGVVWLALLFLVPMCIVVAVSFATSDIINRPVFGWHPSNFRTVFDPLYVRVVARSVGFAGLTTALCLVLGYPVAYTIARFGGRYRNLLIGVVVLPWLIDYLVRIYAWVVILGNEGIINTVLSHLGWSGTPPIQLTNTPYAVIAGLVYAYFPLMVMPLYAVLEQLDKSLIEAGKDLYASPRSTFWHVTLPLSTPGVVAGSLLVFLPCVGDFATARLLGGTSTYMVGNLISDQFQQSGDWPFGAAITVILMGLMWLIILTYLVYAWRQGRKGLEVV